VAVALLLVAGISVLVLAAPVRHSIVNPIMDKLPFFKVSSTPLDTEPQHGAEPNGQKKEDSGERAHEQPSDTQSSVQPTHAGEDASDPTPKTGSFADGNRTGAPSVADSGNAAANQGLNGTRGSPSKGQPVERSEEQASPMQAGSGVSTPEGSESAENSGEGSLANFAPSLKGPSEPDYEALFIQSELRERIPVFTRLSTVRQQVLIEMARQTSVNGLMTFRRMLSALEAGDFNEATRQMVRSQWADRVGDRAFELAQVMRSNDADDLKAWLAEKK
jgi:hypothetical protein